MTEKIRARSTISAAIAFTLLLAGITTAGDDALIRIERRSDADRNALIEAGITLIAETNDALLAVGSPTDIASALEGWSLTATVIEESTSDARFALAGLRPGFTEVDLLACGDVIARGADWLLIEELDFASATGRPEVVAVDVELMRVGNVLAVVDIIGVAVAVDVVVADVALSVPIEVGQLVTVEAEAVVAGVADAVAVGFQLPRVHDGRAVVLAVGGLAAGGLCLLD